MVAGSKLGCYCLLEGEEADIVVLLGGLERS